MNHRDTAFKLWPLLTLAAALTTIGSDKVAAEGEDPPVGTTTSAGSIAFVDPMTQIEAINVQGGVVTQGSPLAGDFDGADNITGNADDGTSTQIALTVPGTAVVKAILYWTVLTNSDEVSNRGQNISFDGNAISGTKIGFSLGRTPCFFQFSTFAWKADVTGFVATGPATHTVAGLPGGNQIFGNDFAEGASLLVVFADATLPAKEVVIYEGLAVTNIVGDTLSQTLTGFQASSLASVVAEWFPVIGNGQQGAMETLFFSGSLGSLDFSNDVLLDGSTSMFPVNSASYTDSVQVDVFWDDDSPDVSAVIGGGSTSASVSYSLTNDCHTFVATWLSVTKDVEVDIDIKPGSFPNSMKLSNHGVIPVAIHTTADFDATTVEPSTVCFGDAEAPLERDCTEAHSTGHIEDVDGDIDLDLVLHFETSETGIDPGDTQACLTGFTSGGTPVEGCDSVRTLDP